MLRLRSILFAILIAVPALAQHDALLAPLPIRDQFLLSNGFFFFTPEAARVLDDGKWSLTVHSADANTFAKSGWISRSLEGRTTRTKAMQALSDPRFQSAGSLFLVDGETHRTDISVRRGFGEHLEIGLSVPLTSVGGGWSDQMIENAHRVMRIGNAERESLRRNAETVYVRHGGTTYARDRNGGVAFGDTAITAKYELAPLEERNLRLAVAGAVELPTGNPRTLDGSGSVDAGAEIIASRDFDHSRVHASLGVLRLGANVPLGTRPQLLITDTVALSHLLSERSSVTVQLTVSESPFRHLGIPEFTRRSYQVSAGTQRQIGTVTVHAAFIENVLNFENSADAGFAWGISRRF